MLSCRKIDLWSVDRQLPACVAVSPRGKVSHYLPFSGRNQTGVSREPISHSLSSYLLASGLRWEECPCLSCLPLFPQTGWGGSEIGQPSSFLQRNRLSLSSLNLYPFISFRTKGFKISFQHLPLQLLGRCSRISLEMWESLPFLLLILALVP